jgi:hypothetical protein
LHDGHILGIHRRNCRGVHGWFFRLWEDICGLLGKLG